MAKVIEKVDSERLAIGSALGYDLTPVGQAFHDAGFGPKGSIWEAINGSHMLTRLKAPGSLDNRWLTEDIPYGIATPIIDSIVGLGSIVMGLDGWTAGRGPIEFGISGMSKEALKQYLKTGEV